MDLTLTEDVAMLVTRLAGSGPGRDHARARKVAKALRLLATDQRHPGLSSHRAQSLAAEFGAAVWESYVENHTPGAWRLWWIYGPSDGEITIIRLGPHP